MDTEHFKEPYLTKDNDLSKTNQSEELINNMGRALSQNANNMEDYFDKNFRWMGNYGCGTKNNLEEFRQKWQLPFRKSFSDRVYVEEARITQGEWVSAFGYIDALHSGEFMGIKPTNKRVKIKYMDFWKIKDDKIVDNWVSVDFAYILHQLGKDIFEGKGWD